MDKVGRCEDDEQGVDDSHGPCYRGCLVFIWPFGNLLHWWCPWVFLKNIIGVFTCPFQNIIGVLIFAIFETWFQVAGPSGGTARPRDVEMERTRLEEKGIFTFPTVHYFHNLFIKSSQLYQFGSRFSISGIGCHRDFTTAFLESIKPFLWHFGSTLIEFVVSLSSSWWFLVNIS